MHYFYNTEHKEGRGMHGSGMSCAADSAQKILVILVRKLHRKAHIGSTVGEYTVKVHNTPTPEMGDKKRGGGL
jgi:hypothetical protein